MRSSCQTRLLSFSRGFHVSTPGGRHGGTWRPPDDWLLADDTANSRRSWQIGVRRLGHIMRFCSKRWTKLELSQHSRARALEHQWRAPRERYPSCTRLLAVWAPERRRGRRH
jgi:hypothetical protein